jgi:hypothetical protein
MLLDQVLPKIVPLLAGLFAVCLGFFFYFLKSDRPELWIASALGAWIVFGVIGAAIIYQVVFAETEKSGLLRPAGDPMPVHETCSTIPSDALVLIYGDSMSYTRRFPHTVLRVAGETLLSLDKKNGGIAVSAKVYSEDRRLVAQIINNKFYINESNSLRPERPDHHTLSVFDQRGQRVLYVRYLNPSAVKVLGVFHTAKGPVQITENGVLWSGVVVTGLCARDSLEGDIGIN